jgi:hypothetical protein
MSLKLGSICANIFGVDMAVAALAGSSGERAAG